MTAPNNDVYTPKQAQLLQVFAHGGLRRINLLHGAVRSGKTYISLVLWAFWVASMPAGGQYLMCAKSLTTLKRNCLVLLQDLVGRRNFTFSLSQKEAKLFGRTVQLEGANDIRSESKIRGMTLQGAYCDELTLFPEDFFAMLLSRLSMPGAKLFATTNPDSPTHWLKAKYIDRADELDMYQMSFTIDENTFLEREYIENLKREYVGVYYSRYILGEWVKAEGLIYPFFGAGNQTDENILPGTFGWTFYISIDYGTLNPCAMILWAVNERQRRAIAIDEFYYSGRGQYAQRTDAEYYGDLVRLAGEYPLESIVIDPSAASFIAEIRKHGRFSVRKANNDVLEGIRRTGAYVKSGQIVISRKCQDTIREFGLYVWDEKSNADRPIKENDHAMDSVRYMAFTILRSLGW
jgi:PBSX family phage terminase large subunit